MACDYAEKVVEMSNKQVIRRWFDDVWNQKNADAIPRLFAAEGMAHGLAADSIRGPEAFTAFQQAFVRAFPDLTITIDDLIEEGDKVVARWHAAGTLTGDGLGVTPTGKQMAITGLTIAIIRGGQIVEGWNSFDVLGMHQQLGTLAQLVGR
jgi:steroid delta-isomerase-like uncharacterized protein